MRMKCSIIRCHCSEPITGFSNMKVHMIDAFSTGAWRRARRNPGVLDQTRRLLQAEHCQFVEVVQLLWHRVLTPLQCAFLNVRAFPACVSVCCTRPSLAVSQCSAVHARDALPVSTPHWERSSCNRALCAGAASEVSRAEVPNDFQSKPAQCTGAQICGGGRGKCWSAFPHRGCDSCDR